MKKNISRIISLIVIDIAIVVFSFLFSNYLLSIKLDRSNLLFYILCCVAESAIIIFAFSISRLYRSLLKYVSMIDLLKIMITIFANFVAGILFVLITDGAYLSLKFIVVDNVILAILLSFARFSIRLAIQVKNNDLFQKQPDNIHVMIVGAGDAGTMVARELINSEKVNKIPVCFIDDDEQKRQNSILGVPIVGGRDMIPEAVKKYDVKEIIVAIPSITRYETRQLLSICEKTNCQVDIIPGIYQLVNGTVSIRSIRHVEITDLLGRGEIKVNLDEIMGYIENRVVLITGGGGSIGSELSRQVAAHNPKRLIILDIYENNAYDIEQELKRNFPYLNLLVLIASIRDKNKLEDVFKKYKIDIVFNAAAHKHVPLMETSPNEAIKNNVFGTLNLAKLADEYKVKRFVQISTDKAVNPTNIMGASKRICEMIIQAIGRRSKNTEFVAVRFGNVLGSNGSVIPLFKKQIALGGPVTVTHREITRYFMTIPEAVTLILQAGAYAKGGEIYVLDMGEPVKIYDLAETLIRLSGFIPHKDIKIQVTGLRPGEKLYEERLMDEEGLKTTDNGLINIAKPIEFDEDKFFECLDRLCIEAYNESEGIKPIVKELVPTYKI